MKKTLIPLGLFLLVFAAGFIWLLSGTAPENAPDTEVTVDLTDQHIK